MTRDPRSYLFVPGDRPDRFDKALASGADRIILDLEDAVAPDGKAAARRAVHEWASRCATTVVVRVNAGDSPWFAEDVAMAARLPACEIMVPKSDPAALAAVAQVARGPLIALVETVAGLLTLRAAAALPGVARIAFGNLDFGLDAGIPGPGSALDLVRTQIVLESRFANRPAPIDGVTTALADEGVLASDLAQAKAFGFGAKLCIHPRQVAATNACFQPSEAERAWAARVIEAAAAGGGAAVAVDGKMVDRPVLARAEAILDQAILDQAILDQAILAQAP